MTRRPARRPPPRPPAPRTVPPPSPLGPAARRLLTALAALLAVLLVGYAIYDPDLWQHLRVGRALWEGLGFPAVNLWTWPTLGAPDLVPSWLFRALLWPFWQAGEVGGVFAWRFLTTLAAFGLALAAARAGHRAGWPAAPTGVAALAAVLWCVVIYRYRSQARPETLVAVLLAAQLLVLESWRARGGGRRVWLLPVIAALWSNAHISYYIGLFVTSAYALDALARRARRRPGPRPRTLLLVLVASGAASFAHPYGWRALAQPFEYWLVWRHEPIFRIIGELAAPDWEAYAPAGLVPWLLLLALLPLLRLGRSGPDLAQLAILAFLLPQSLLSQRFLGYLAVAAAPFFARDLTWALSRLPRPAALARPGARAALGALALAGLALPSLLTDPLRPDPRIRWASFPVVAADVIEREGVRGRAFNLFQHGGYLLWRFWPDSTRLPFMDIHQTGTRDDRRLYVYALAQSAAWRELDRRHGFDWALLSRLEHERVPLLDALDADSAWALVFVDDAAALYVRRSGANARLAERAALRHVPGGEARLATLGPAVYADTALARVVRAELEASAAASPWNASALSPLANMALAEGRPRAALELLARAERIAPRLDRLHLRRGIAYLELGDAARALAAFDRERRRDPGWRDAGLWRGRALAALGRRSAALAAYRAAAARGVAAAADSAAALERAAP